MFSHLSFAWLFYANHQNHVTKTNYQLLPTWYLLLVSRFDDLLIAANYCKNERNYVLFLEFPLKDASFLESAGLQIDNEIKR